MAGKKALYIHGLKVKEEDMPEPKNDRGALDLGSFKKGASFVNVKESLLEHGFDCLSISLDLLDAESAARDIREFAIREKIGLIVASSLGGFYAICLPLLIPVIALNPCLRPSKEVRKLRPDVLKSTEQAWAKMETDLEKIKPAFKRFKYAIFAENDDLFCHKDIFDAIFTRERSALVPGPHQLSRYKAFLNEPLSSMLETIRRNRAL